MRNATIFSMMLNAVLAGIVVWLTLKSSRPQAQSAAAPSVSNRVVRAKSTVAAPVTSAASPQTVGVDEAFQWSQLESSDYRVYVANLRGIGCPEATVRDIVIADVDDVFAPRLKQLVDGVTGDFWTLMSQPKKLEKLVDEKHTLIEGMQTERDDILKSLFGSSEPLQEERMQNAASLRRDFYGELGDFLSDEKRTRYIAARDQLEQEWIRLSGQGNMPDAERKAKRKEFVEAHEKQWREWLTQEDLDELHLRESPATEMRFAIRGMDVSDDEVHSVAKIQYTAAQANNSDEAKEQAQAQLQQLFGDRYATFERSADNTYQGFYSVANRLELPESAAAEGYNIRRQAEAAAKTVTQNAALSEAERTTMLEAIRVETEKSLGTALGAKGLSAYQKVDGNWLQELNKTAK